MGKPKIYKRFGRWYCAGLGLVVCGHSPASVWRGWSNWRMKRLPVDKSGKNEVKAT